MCALRTRKSASPETSCDYPWHRRHRCADPWRRTRALRARSGIHLGDSVVALGEHAKSNPEASSDHAGSGDCDGTVTLIRLHRIGADSVPRFSSITIDSFPSFGFCVWYDKQQNMWLLLSRRGVRNRFDQYYSRIPIWLFLAPWPMGLIRLVLMTHEGQSKLDVGTNHVEQITRPTPSDRSDHRNVFCTYRWQLWVITPNFRGKLVQKNWLTTETLLLLLLLGIEKYTTYI
jgi:hypothetical protein